jgi:hypothetical protein
MAVWAGKQAGQKAGKALINSNSDDHENANIFYKN